MQEQSPGWSTETWNASLRRAVEAAVDTSAVTDSLRLPRLSDVASWIPSSDSPSAGSGNTQGAGNGGTQGAGNGVTQGTGKPTTAAGVAPDSKPLQP